MIDNIYAQKYSFKEWIALTASVVILLITFPISMLFCIKIVQEYDRLVIFRLGKLCDNNPKGPGIVLMLPFIDTHMLIDLRVMSYDVPTQEMLTLDSVTIGVDAAIYYRTCEPVASITCVTDAHYSTRQLVQSTIRNVIGTRTLAQIMENRAGIAKQIRLILHDTISFWGMDIERVEIKDIRLPRNMCRVMAAEAEAQRESDAKVVAARGELNASFALQEAANELKNSKTALHLRYLQTLVKISAHDNHTIILPVPMKLFNGG